MTSDERRETLRPGMGVPRRTFLIGAAGGMVAACSGSDDDPSSRTTTTLADTVTTDPSSEAELVEAPPMPEDVEVFTLGVCSGDPTSESVILWTRLAIDPLVAGGGMPDQDVVVAYDVAADRDFTELIASGTTTAPQAFGHSVHLDVTGLEPETVYYFRFRIGERTSPIGRTRTLAAQGSTPDDFTFVMASCMDRQWGNYAAWRRAAETEGLHAILFLGDFIYELNLGDGAPDGIESRAWTVPAPIDLDTYRTRYGQTLTDASLQLARQAAPWIVTWDDHEVANNYAADTNPLLPDAADDNRARRAAAYQAWYENQPVRLEVPSDWGDFPIHRALNVGDLATFHVIETRQYADEPPCRVPGQLILTDTAEACDEVDDESRTNLGADQEAWLLDSLSGSTSTWNLLANPIVLSGIDVAEGDEPPAYELDSWDGYPAVRRRLVEHLESESISNPVVLTGDWHSSFVLDLRNDAGETVAPEFLVTAISTILFDDDHTARNPHMRYFGAGHGFATCTATPEHFTTTFSYIEDVWDPDSPIVETSTWRVLAGETEASEVT